MSTIAEPAPAPVATGGRDLTATIAALALLSAAAGFIHAAVVDSHRGHGVAADVFTAIAVFQVAWAGLVLVRPVRWVVAAGAAGNAAVLGGWVLNRTSGIPFLDGFEEAEQVGLTDGVAAALEVLLVLGAVAVLAPAARRTWLTDRFADVNLGVVAAIVALLAVPAVAEAGSFHDHGQTDLAAHGEDGHAGDDGHHSEELAAGREEDGHAEDDGHHGEELAAGREDADHAEGAAHDDGPGHGGDGHDDEGDGHGHGDDGGEGDATQAVAAGHGRAGHDGSSDDHDHTGTALARIGSGGSRVGGHTGTHRPSSGAHHRGPAPADHHDDGRAPHVGGHAASPSGPARGHGTPPAGHVGAHGPTPGEHVGPHVGPPADHAGAHPGVPADQPADHPAGHPAPQDGHGGHGTGAEPPGSGVTPEQRAAADGLLAATKATLPQWTDEAAHAAGFRTIGDGGTGTEHLVNWRWITDDVVLDPNRPESLVYNVSPDGTRQLAAAMFILPPGADVPDVGGTLTQWHIHNNLCFSPETDVDGHPARRVIGLTTDQGTCTRGERLPDAAMLHVWIVDHPCGPFSSLEGVGAGQAIDEAQDPHADPACQHSTH